jgi:hypothetical protein
MTLSFLGSYSVNGRWMKHEYGALVEWHWQGKTKGLGGKLSHCRFLYHNSHKGPLRIEHWPPRWDASDWLTHCTDYNVAEIIRNLVAAKLRYWSCDCSEEMGKAIRNFSKFIVGVPAKLRSRNRAWTNFLRYHQLYQDWIISQIYNQPWHFKLNAG